MRLDKKRLSAVLSALVATFIVLAAFELARRFRAGAVHVDAVWLVGSAGALALGYVAQAWGFHRLVVGASSSPPPRVRVAELFFRGMLARYLPGKVGIPAVRMAGADSLSVSVGFMGASVVLESLAWLASGFVLTLFLSLGPWAPPHLSQLWDQPWAKLAVIAAVTGAATLGIVQVRRYPAWFLRFLRLEAGDKALLPPVLLLSTGAFWVGTACASAALALAWGGSSEAAYLAAAAGMAAPLVGFLALPVPAGLGVREAVLVMALSGALGESGALAFGLVSRAVALGTEVLLWVTTRWTLGRWENRQPASEARVSPAD